MTTQTYRRARHSVSLLHAHLVFVTKYRRKVFTDAMISYCESSALSWVQPALPITRPSLSTIA